MVFQLDHDIYNKSAQMRLSERLGNQSIAASEQGMEANAQKMRQARAAELVAMVTPDGSNYGAIRQQAIAEGVGSEDTIPRDFDPNYISTLKASLKGQSANIPAAIQEYSLFQRMNPDERRDFLMVKRANPYLNLGDSFAQPDPSVPGAILGSIDKGVAPATKITKDGQVVTTPGIPGSALNASGGGAANPTSGRDTNPPAGGGVLVQDLPPSREEMSSAKADIATTEDLVSLIDQMIGNEEEGLPEHPGLRAAVGGVDSKTPSILDDTVDFEALLEQTKGGAFLESIQKMRGLGALSNAEGMAATAASTRMRTAMSEEGFKKAAKEYRDIIMRGKARLEQKLNPTLSTTIPGNIPDTPMEAPATPQRRWKVVNPSSPAGR